jgi:hypothetical protein
MSQSDRRLNSCLMGIILGLILVGLVSGTPLRHVVQVLPACIVLVALNRPTPWTSYAALAIFIFWLLIMALIWLHILGLAHILSGNFSRAETVLTFFIGGWCLVGLFRFFTTPTSAKLAARVTAFAGFALLQIAALWLSLQPSLSNR